MPGAVAGLVLALVLVACGGSGSSGDPDLGLTTTAVAGPAGSYGPPTAVGTIADPAVVESSGLAASLRNRGRLWTHNDSGDEPLVYCLEEDGSSCGTWRVAGAVARDWEDMAVGPGPEPGRPYLYLGDIGDNARVRSEIVVYRVPEPDVGPPGPVPAGSPPRVTEPAQAIRLAYPDGAHDAEALMVSVGSGDIYVVTKDRGAAGVYRAPAPGPGTGLITMEAVGVVEVGRGQIDPRNQLVTGGDISPDASRVILSTYGLGYELVLPPSAASFDAVWSVEPTPVPLGVRAQGEAVAYSVDGAAIYATTEGAASPILRTARVG